MSSTTTTTDWIELVRQRESELGSLQKVADELGYARPSLSLAIRGKYKGRIDNLKEAVLKKYAAVTCPYLAKTISHIECAEYRDIEAPTHNPAAMRHWKVCQHCSIGCSKKRKREKTDI